MGLVIDDPEVSRMIAEIAAATGETETEVVRRAMRDRKERLGLPSVEDRVQQIVARMDRELAPLIAREWRGKTISQGEQDEILGYGPEGHRL